MNVAHRLLLLFRRPVANEVPGGAGGAGGAAGEPIGMLLALTKAA